MTRATRPTARELKPQIAVHSQQRAASNAGRGLAYAIFAGNLAVSVGLWFFCVLRHGLDAAHNGYRLASRAPFKLVRLSG